MRSKSLQFSLAVLLVAVRSAAAAPTKEECIEAHGRGQDQEQAGHLALARDSFAVCSQPSCPALVQSDCARFTEELTQLSPSVTFAARDQRANDLPDTEVYLDGALVARRLDEGRTFDVDPGKHAVRFIHGDRDVLLNVVINQAEHGRSLIATFTEESGAPVAEAALSGSPSAKTRVSSQESRRSALPLVFAIGGGAALVTGGVLTAVGLAKIPASCTLKSRECTVPPGDPAFDQAHSGVSLADAGLTTAIAGAVIGIGGLVWYLAQSPGPEQPPSSRVGFTGTGFVF